jgi:predicted RNase H-like HicB family nuclease
MSKVACFGGVLCMKSCHFHHMTSTYTAMIQQEDGWWIGWIEEVPGVNAQERTKESLLASLREALKETLEFNREDARASAQGSYTEELVTV